jgi:thiol-disulfide isomerase/thioredoxin
MGCCGRNKTKGKSKTDVTKRNKIEKKTNSINDVSHSNGRFSIDSILYSKKTIPIDETQLLKTEPEQSIPIVENLTRIKSPLISSPDYDIDDFIGNISPIKTLNDLQKSVEKNDKPVSIILFYGRYCPYSKRTMPDLRQWARANQDRIFLYEADVEQALDLAEYYHIRSIPTIMAFEEKNLIAPIWQRTATNVLSSSSIDESERIDEEFDNSNNLYVVLDPPHEKSDHIESVNDMEQEQSNIDLDQMSSKIFKILKFSFLIFDIFRSR